MGIDIYLFLSLITTRQVQKPNQTNLYLKIKGKKSLGKKVKESLPKDPLQFAQYVCTMFPRQRIAKNHKKKSFAVVHTTWLYKVVVRSWL